MNEKRRNWITWAFILVTIVVVLLMLTSTLQRPNRIQLPATDISSGQTSADTEGNDALKVISVTPKTVQAAIESLERPEAYQRDVTVEQIWSGGSGTMELTTTVRDGWTRTDRTLPGGRVRHSVTDGETTHIWYNGDAAVYTAAAGDISADDEQGIPTYEDVLALPADQIVTADYRVISDVNCIYVETAPDEDGYVFRYWINVETGLLAVAEKLMGEEAVYRMAALTVNDTIPEANLFVLPDGRALIEE